MQIRRLLSKIYRTLFPINMVEMYRRMGVQIGENCKIQFDVVIDYSHYWHITIGNNVTIAPRVHIIAHDASTKKDLGVAYIGKVNISDDVFIGAGSIILPGVTIGKGAIIGAGSVVSKDIKAGMLALGNPAKEVGTVQEYLDKHRERIKDLPVFDESYTLRGKIGPDMMKEMNNRMKDGFGYVD